MKKRDSAWMQAWPGGLRRKARAASGFPFVFAVSVEDVGWGQTISFTDQPTLCTPIYQTHTSPLFDLSSDAASAAMPPQRPSFHTTVAADAPPMFTVLSLGGSWIPTSGMATTVVLVAPLWNSIYFERN